MIFAFDDLRVDDQRLEIRGADGPIPIEPRVLDTLLHLIRHRDRVVSKQQLLAEVWRAEHVSDAAVSRCIMEARRAIGDDGQGRVIKTVHGRGYRFVASVEELDGEGRPSKTSAEGASRRNRALGLLGVLVLVVAATYWWRTTRDSVSPEPKIPTLAMLSAVAAEDTDLRWLAQSLEDALRLSLAATSVLELRPAAETAFASLEGVLAAAADDAAVDGVIGLSFAPGDIDGFARLDAELVRLLPSGGIERAPLGLLILPQLSPGSREGFDSIRAAVVGTVVPRLTATLDPQRAAEPNRREAWQLYLRAVTQWEPMCEAGAAEDLVNRALELDPELVAAWTMLAYVRLTQSKFCAGMMDAFAALTALSDRLFELDPDSPTPHALRATALLYQGEVEEAYDTLEAAGDRFGDSLAVRLGRSTVLRYVGLLDTSRRLFDGAVEELPALPYVAGFVPYAYRYLGDWEGFLSFMTGQESPHFRFYRGLAEHMLGNDATAIEVLEPAFAVHPGDLYGRLCQALLAIVQGDTDEARVLLLQLSRQRRDNGLDGEVTFEIAHLMQLAGERAAGLEQLELAIEQGFFCAPCIENDAAFAELASQPEYRDLLARARRRQLEFQDRFGVS